MPSGQQQQREVEALCFRSSNEEMPCADKKEDEHEKCEEETAQNLLAIEFH